MAAIKKEVVYHSKGFHPKASIQEFPIHKQQVLLLVKRRRWESQVASDMVSRGCKVVQMGAGMIAELAAFLKGGLDIHPILSFYLG